MAGIHKKDPSSRARRKPPAKQKAKVPSLYGVNKPDPVIPAKDVEAKAKELGFEVRKEGKIWQWRKNGRGDWQWLGDSSFIAIHRLVFLSK